MSIERATPADLESLESLLAAQLAEHDKASMPCAGPE
jgi:hypothetical protein